MKGFFIFLFLFVGSLVSFMVFYSEISQSYMDKIILEEGGPYPNPEFEKLKVEDPAAFKAKFEGCLKGRIRIAKMGSLVGKAEIFRKVAAETKEMYFNSSLVSAEGMDGLIFALAHDYLEQNKIEEGYWVLRDFIENYPSSPDITLARNEANHLKFKHGFGDR